MNYYKILFLFLILLIIRVIYNLYYYFLTRYFYEKFKNHLSDNKDWFINENRQRIAETLKKANIINRAIPFVEPVGYGHVTKGSARLFDNMGQMEERIVQAINVSFREAIAVFKNRSLESFNPIFWLNFLLFLPRNILTYIGIKENNIVVKVFQVLYWAISVFSALVSVLFNQEFTDFLKGMFQK